MSKKIPQLDAVRGIAILLVILHNQTPKYQTFYLDRLFVEGWMGVDLFFVLSGFLITGILLDTKGSDGYLRNFYARRCLRIWPLYYSVIFGMFVLVPLAVPSEAETVFSRSSPWWAYPIFLQNLILPNPTHATGPLGVTWSVAIEEQFYLAWPWVVRYMSSRQLRRLAVLVLLLSPAFRLAVSFQDVNLYSNTFCRLDGLMAGAFLAALVRSPEFSSERLVRPAWICLFVAAPLAITTAALQAMWIVFSFVALASAALVFLALFSPRKWLQQALTNRFLVYTGTISYGLYLLHKLPFDAVEAFGLELPPGLVLFAGIGLSYGIAAASWEVLEQPFLKLKRYFEPGRRPPDGAARAPVFAP